MSFVYSKQIKSSFTLKNKIYIITVFVVLFLVSALRAKTVGTDTPSYYYRVSYIAKRGIDFNLLLSQKAPLYDLIMFLFSKILPAKQLYQIVSSLIIEGLFACYIIKCSDNYFISTWIFLMQYLFFQSLNVSRQFMAVALVAYAISELIQSEKTKKAFIIMILAVGIHSTALVALPILLLTGKRERFLRIYTGIISSLVILYPLLLKVFVSLFPKYSFYLNGRFFETGKNRKIILTLFQLLFWIYAIYIYNRNKKRMKEQDEKKYKCVLYISFIGIIIGFAALKSILITRLEYYYSISFLVLAPITIKYSGENKKIVSFSLIIIMSIPGLFLLQSGNGGILPYSFFWEHF